MSKPTEIYDELGVCWFVFDSDPADQLVKQLAKRGLSLIVLPRETIKTGTVVEAPEPDFSGITDDILEIEEVRQQVLRQTRAYEIYKYLTGDQLSKS